MSSQRAKPGRSLGLGPPEGQAWSWKTNVMLGSITHRALGISATRMLDFLIYEHAAHAGKENGRLGASYLQLGRWGVTEDDIPLAIAELEVTGFVLQTSIGPRVAGGKEPSRFALTWLPTLPGSPDGGPATHKWLDVLKALQSKGVGSVAATKAWLKNHPEVAEHSRSTRRRLKEQAATPHLRVVNPAFASERR